VFYDGDVYHVIDGWHRFTATLEVGLKEIPCIVFDDRKEAILVGLECNQDHGLPLNDGDKAHRIKIAVAEFPELSNRKIADIVNCNSRYVDRIVNKWDLRTGTQWIMGENGKMRLASKKRKEPDNPPMTDSSVPSIPINRIIGELKVALKLPEADNQRTEALVKFVLTLQKDGFTVGKNEHRKEFVQKLGKEFGMHVVNS